MRVPKRAARQTCAAARRERGFTVAEVVVAASILFSITASVAAALSFSAVQAENSSRREGALNLANKQIELARNIAYDDVGTQGGEPPGVLDPEVASGSYTIRTNVEWQREQSSGRATYKKVYVTVEWQHPRQGSVSVETAVFGRSYLTNSGDVIVDCVNSQTGQPIQGATVTITPTGGTARSGTTDSEGEAFFGYVPSGRITVIVEKAGFIFDLTPLSGATVVADNLTRLSVVGYPPATVVVQVRTPGDEPIADASVQMTGLRGLLSGITGIQGDVSFLNLFGGRYDLAVTAEGRVPASLGFDLASGESTSVVVTMADPATLRVRAVNSATGQPVGGALVTLAGPQVAGPTATGEDGAASFSLNNSGTYTVTVAGVGYLPSIRTTSVTVGETQDLEVPITPLITGAMHVRTVRSSGAPRPYTSIFVQSSDGSYSQTAQTDGNGYWNSPPLTPGTYRVMRSGRPTTQRTVQVLPAITAYVEIQ